MYIFATYTFFFFSFFFVYSLAICVWNLYTFETKIRAAMRFKNIKNEHRMERRKTEATGGNWPRIDILCKHVENVYIGGKRIAWKIEVTSGWKNNEGFLISRTPSQSCESKKIGTFENLSKCEFRDRGLKSYQLEIERLIIWLFGWLNIASLNIATLWCWN